MARRKEWGGLSSRTATVVRKVLGFRSLQELKAASPSLEDLISRKWVGMVTVRELAKVLPRLAEELATPRTKAWTPEIIPFREPAPVERPLPPQASQATEFFDEVVKAGLRAPPGETRSAEVACMAGPRSRWCLGVVQVRRIVERQAVAWSCPRCGKGGELHGVGEFHH